MTLAALVNESARADGYPHLLTGTVESLPLTKVLQGKN